DYYCGAWDGGLSTDVF
nr:immunoglobulin light chain junction region [Macaca mulatta]MOV96182.1 immunoglobulin light chain junction region [Macaca mulatta]MOV97985.1 immunoglobulin light chain junction region [Macaca mulatta]MOW00824.1 immunoglobulin light chain junction region [Macaca mulatta]MOW01087.1 immunoglobulin light chain junction region [Macaca mulatta]